MRLTSILLVYFSLTGCTSTGKSSGASESSSKKVVNLSADILEGRWYLTGRESNSMSKEILPLSKCDRNFFWEFKKTANGYKQTQHTPKSADCKEYAVTSPASATINNGMLEYFLNDISFAEPITFLGNNKFSIIRTDIQNNVKSQQVMVFERR